MYHMLLTVSSTDPEADFEATGLTSHINKTSVPNRALEPIRHIYRLVNVLYLTTVTLF